MSELTNPHDRFFKETFTRIELAQDFFAHYLPQPVAATMNLNTLVLQSGSFVDPDLQQQFADLLYRVALRDGGDAYLYLLLEHKSYADPQTPFQLLRYLIRIWERDVRTDGTLRPILPLVVYHGQNQWHVPLSFSALYTGPDALRPYWPAFQYELQDLSAFSDAEIRGALELRISLLVLKYIFDPRLRTRLGDILALFNQLADTQSALEYLGTVLYYIGMAGAQMTSEEMATAVKSALADKGSELMQTIARQWIAEGIEQGVEQGLEQGRLQTLQEGILDLLQTRFGDVSKAITEQVITLTDVKTLRLLLREAAMTAGMADFSKTLSRFSSESTN